MTTTETNLGDLRAKIDRIDDQLHDLLMARATLVDDIRRRKDVGGAPVVQPAREAQILRRLAARHKGPLPFGAVARIWREIMATFAHMQHALAVAVYAPDDLPGPWDLARDHYGSQVAMTPYHTASQVIRAIADRSAALGILPMPVEHDREPWWRQLMSHDASVLRVMARLPFASRGNARGSADVLVVGSNIGDVAGFDLALIAVEFPTETSRTKLTSSLASAGLKGTIVLVETNNGLSVALAEVVGPVAQDDPRLTELSAQLGERPGGVYHLGGYAAPLTPLASPRKSPARTS